MNNYLKKYEYYLPIFCFLILFFLLLFLNWPFRLNSDEGVVLEGAWNLANNKQLYIDFFEFVPPGSFYAIFGVWKIFGPTFWAANLFSILMLFAGAVGVYKISEIINPKKNYNLIFPFIYSLSLTGFPIINHNLYNIVFLIWASYFFIKAILLDSNKSLLLAGFLTGVSALFLQHRGLIFFLGCFLFLSTLIFLKKTKIKWVQLALFSIFFILPIFFLFIFWNPKILFDYLIIFPFFNYTDVNKLPPFLLIFFLLLTVSQTILFRKEKSIVIIFLIYLQFILIISTIPRPDINHLFLIAFPTICLLGEIYKKIVQEKLLLKYFCSSVFLIYFSLILLCLVINIATIFPWNNPDNTNLLNYINLHCPGKNDLYAGPFIPGLYHASGKINPTPFGFLVTNHLTEEQFALAAEMLKKNPPKCAVYNFKIVEKFKYEKNNPVDNFILNNYAFAKQFGNRIVLIKY